MAESGDHSKEYSSMQMRRLVELMEQLKAKQETMEQNASTWQQRLESKMDRQLALSSQHTFPAVSPSAAVGHLSNGATSHTSVSWDPERPGTSDSKTSVVTDVLPGTLPVQPGPATSPNSLDTAWLCEDSPEPPRVATAAAESQSAPQNAEGTEARESLESESSEVSRPTSPKAERFQKQGKKTTFMSRKNLSSTRSLGDRSSKKKRSENIVIAKARAEMEDSLSFLHRLTTHKRFEVSVMALIMFNAFAIGWQVQVVAIRTEESFMTGKAYDTKPPIVFVVLQTLFTILFAMELGLRWAAEGFVEFLRMSDEIWWNLFDIIAVMAGLVELILELSSPKQVAVASISVIRVLRVMRLVRLVRLIRIYPFFHELRMMVESCLNSLKLFLWLMMVLMLFTYIFGIFMTTGTCTYLSDGQRRFDRVLDADSANLQSFWGTVDRSMLSLFQTITGGRDWYEFYDHLLMLDVTKRWIYLLYISFAIFAVCNVVAAVFVESAMQSSAHDRELLIREQLRDSQAYQDKMLGVFEEMDSDGTGTITMDEFLTHLDDDRVIAYFNSMKLDVTDATALFKLLDVDRSGSVEIHEFIDGCQRLKGESRTLDMHLMRYELHNIGFELHELATRLYASEAGVALKDISVEKPKRSSYKIMQPQPGDYAALKDHFCLPPTVREVACVSPGSPPGQPRS